MVLPLDYGVMITDDEPVRLLDAILEGLNYNMLHQLYSSSCDGCPFRKNCQKYKGDNPPKHPKHIYISTRYNELLKKNMEIFGSPYGTCLRINRSIQVEGVFGILKQDYGFWRLLHRGAKNVRKYMLLLAMGYNIKKLHNRNIDGRLGIRLFQEKISA